MPDRIIHLSKKYLSSPVKISTVAYVDPKKLKQIYYAVRPDDMKFSLLSHLLKKEHEGLIMVFCNTRRIVDSISSSLKAQGINAIAIHGGLTQNKRDDVMARFHAKSSEVLVCTDVAARGLDISGVSHIYNYDVPKDNNDYVHRIGRTARAGKEGMVINLITRRDYGAFKSLQRELGISILEDQMPVVEKVAFVMGGERRGGERGSGFRGGGRGGFGRRPERRGRSSGSGGGRPGGFRGGSAGGFRPSSGGGRFIRRPEAGGRTGGYSSEHSREESGEKREGTASVQGDGRREGGYHSERSGERREGRFGSRSGEGRRTHEDGDGARSPGGRWGKPRNKPAFRKVYRKR